MKTIELKSKVTQNSPVAKALGHPGKDFRPGTLIDVSDKLPRILRGFGLQFNELEYFSYNLIQLRRQQLPPSKYTVYPANQPKTALKQPKTLIYKSRETPEVIEQAIERLKLRNGVCQLCGDFIPLPSNLSMRGKVYKKDMYCAGCLDIA